MNLSCQSCGAQLVVAETLRTTTCPYCAAPSVVERPPSRDRPPPTFALGFVQTPAKAKELARQNLLRRSFWAPSSVRNASVEELRGIYVPAWLYSALAESDFSASIGENYTETETYTTTENGRTVTKTRQVTKTEWRPLRGRHTEYVPDVIVTASSGLPNDELEHIEPFDLRGLRRYHDALVAGWITEEPSLAQEQCMEQARDEVTAYVKKRLAAFMPGDSHRELSFSTRFHNEALVVCLLPVWVMALRHDLQKPPLRFLVNGQTGKVYGRVPVSWVKVALAVLLALLVAGGLYLLFSSK
ncbi:hypothetical protein [Hyalangium rubrum]|uniref:Zinc ribbon domain-containing protein n=1 Tax=Hyalangium rubrum TaxID=3103134 RepID=A0ABU5H6I3_9BACT|nr:hypothetical protein [Hyalangium sp. s54d21]MDY7228372.1 hypothetical protein [Hyalangium sp. s54d21]